MFDLGPTWNFVFVLCMIQIHLLFVSDTTPCVQADMQRMVNLSNIIHHGSLVSWTFDKDHLLQCENL